MLCKVFLSASLLLTLLLVRADKKFVDETEQKRYQLIIGGNNGNPDDLVWNHFVQEKSGASAVASSPKQKNVHGAKEEEGHHRPRSAGRYREVCSCPEGSLILGQQVVTADGCKTQQWICYSFTPDCGVKCRQWDNFLSFCKETKITYRPHCYVSDEIFDNLPPPPAGTSQYLTVGPKGWALVQTQEPLCTSPGSCDCESSPICLRRGFDNPFSCPVPRYNNWI